MPSKMPIFANEVFRVNLPKDGEKAITPHLIVTEENNCYAIWHVRSVEECLLVGHGRRDAMLFAAAHWDGAEPAIGALVSGFGTGKGAYK